MKKINENFVVSDGATFELISDTYCQITSAGTLLALTSGGTAVAYNGGTAVAYNGSRAVAYNGGRICKTWNLANDGNYQLYATDDGYFYAGCAVNLTREQALKRWDRDDDRACLFTLAILSLDW